MKECPKCGKPIDKGSNFCRHCKADLTEMSKKKDEPKKNVFSNKLVIAIIIVVIAVVAVAFASGMFSSNDTSVNDDSSSDSAQVNSDSSDEGHVYWASVKGEKFHKPNCEWAQKISEDNKIVYHSRQDAIDDDKIPCGECNP